MTIRLASRKDIDEIMYIMESVKEGIENKEWFVEDDRNYVLEHLEDREQGTVLKAVADERIVGFLIIHVPGDSKDNLGNQLHFEKKQLNEVLHMESMIVIPEARGAGIQRKLLLEAERMIPRDNDKYILATVHPDNVYSRRNFRQMGYEEAAFAKKYGGLPRIIMKKEVACI